MPKPLKAGEILNDTQKGQWKIGVSIGVGGFGEIYSACKVGSTVKKVEDYPFVVKIVSGRRNRWIQFHNI
jgi:vaccinia related kinase